MASMTELFPAPVGPVRANNSRSEKSTSTLSRKGAKPSTTRRLGLMGLSQQLGEQSDHALVVGVALTEVLLEQRGAAASCSPPVAGRGGAPGRVEHHAACLGHHLAHFVGQADPGRLVEDHADVVLGVDLGGGG